MQKSSSLYTNCLINEFTNQLVLQVVYKQADQNHMCVYTYIITDRCTYVDSFSFGNG